MGYAEQYARALDWGDIVAEQPALYTQRVTDADEISHGTEIARSQAGKLPLALASGFQRALVQTTLEAIGMAELFQAIVTLDDTRVGKPSPDLFLMAARHGGAAIAGETLPLPGMRGQRREP